MTQIRSEEMLRTFSETQDSEKLQEVQETQKTQETKSKETKEIKATIDSIEESKSVIHETPELKAATEESTKESKDETEELLKDFRQSVESKDATETEDHIFAAYLKASQTPLSELIDKFLQGDEVELLSNRFRRASQNSTDIDFAKKFTAQLIDAKAANKITTRQLVLLGLAYECGFGVGIDLMKARECYENAKSDREAMVHLGSFHHEGSAGFTVNPKKAEDLYKKAAKLGSALALVELADVYASYGPIERPDFDDALILLKQAVHHKNSSAAKLRIGILLAQLNKYKDIPVDQSPDIFNWYEEAAKQGNPAALSCLGELYLLSKHPDVDKALKYINQAGQDGCLAAYLQLGEIYNAGNEFQKFQMKDAKKAYEYFKKVADSPYPNPRLQLFSLGGLLEMYKKDESLAVKDEALISGYAEQFAISYRKAKALGNMLGKVSAIFLLQIYEAYQHIPAFLYHISIGLNDKKTLNLLAKEHPAEFNQLMGEDSAELLMKMLDDETIKLLHSKVFAEAKPSEKIVNLPSKNGKTNKEMAMLVFADLKLVSDIAKKYPEIQKSEVMGDALTKIKVLSAIPDILDESKKFEGEKLANAKALMLLLAKNEGKPNLDPKTRDVLFAAELLDASEHLQSVDKAKIATLEKEFAEIKPNLSPDDRVAYREFLDEIKEKKEFSASLRVSLSDEEMKELQQIGQFQNRIDDLMLGYPKDDKSPVSRSSTSKPTFFQKAKSELQKAKNWLQHATESKSAPESKRASLR